MFVEHEYPRIYIHVFNYPCLYDGYSMISMDIHAICYGFSQVNPTQTVTKSDAA